MGKETQETKEKTSFIQKNRNYLIAFSIIIFLAVLLVFYGIRAGILVPQGTVSAGGAQIGVSISTPPAGALPGNEEEKKAVYRSQEINRRADYGLFETELKSLGWFERGGKTQFRVDIWVHNTGKQTEQFMWEKAKIMQVPNIEYKVTSALFDGKDIPSDGVREGYLLFDGVPESISGDVTITIGHSIGFSTILGFTSQVPHKFELTLK